MIVSLGPRTEMTDGSNKLEIAQEMSRFTQ